jgi:hypothetical protein
MGILDDAIRQHLDLKRQRGATESELKQLEDEAFGPPSRPGEPDFPGGQSHEQNGNGGPATEAAVAEPPPATDEAADSSPDAEPSASEHPVVESPPEEADEPAAVQEQLETAEPTESEDLTAIYDQTSDRELDVAAEVEAEEPEPAPASPIESLDTVEHALPPEETAEPSSSPGEEPAHEPEDEAVPAVEEEEEHEELPSEEELEPHPDQEEGEEAGDDVLADTPEFLKDAPEDDELWFEQGEPKDFDF